MNWMQCFLLFGSSALFLLYLAIFRTVLLDRMVAATILGLVVFFITFPRAATGLAHGLSVGRGTDLLLYLFVVFTAFAFLLVCSRLSKLERTQTALIRHLAIVQARTPAEILDKVGEQLNS